MTLNELNELNELVISYGLKAERRINHINCMYKDLVVLVYDKSEGKAAVWTGSYFSVMDSKTVIEVTLKNTIMETKKEDLENKLGKIAKDF